MRKRVALYQSHLHSVGGIETFILNFCRRMHSLIDITFIYNKADFFQLSQIAKYVDCVKLGSEDHIFDTVIFASNWGESPSGKILAEKYIQMIHADYEVYKKMVGFEYVKYPETTHHVAVSENCKVAFEKITPYKVDKVIYNLC